jgi:hypothetical protein
MKNFLLIAFGLASCFYLRAQQMKETWVPMKTQAPKNLMGMAGAGDIMYTDDEGLYLKSGTSGMYASTTNFFLEKMGKDGKSIYGKTIEGKDPEGNKMSYVDALMVKGKVAAFFYERSKKTKEIKLGYLLIDKSTGDPQGPMQIIETVGGKETTSSDIIPYQFAQSPDSTRILVLHQVENDDDKLNILANVYDSDFKPIWKSSDQTTQESWASYCLNPAVDNKGNVYFVYKHRSEGKKDPVKGGWIYRVEAKTGTFSEVTLDGPGTALSGAFIRFSEKQDAVVIGTYSKDSAATSFPVRNGMFAALLDAETGKVKKSSQRTLEQKYTDATLKKFILGTDIRGYTPYIRMETLEALKEGGYVATADIFISYTSSKGGTTFTHSDIMVARLTPDLDFQWLTPLRKWTLLQYPPCTYGVAVTPGFVYVLFGDSKDNQKVTKDNMYSPKCPIEEARSSWKFRPVLCVIDLSKGTVLKRDYIPFENENLLYLCRTLHMDTPGKAFLFRSEEFGVSYMLGRLEFD